MPKEMFDFKSKLYLVSDEVYEVDESSKSFISDKHQYFLGIRLRIHLTPHPYALNVTLMYVMVTPENANPVHFIGVPRDLLKEVKT